MLDIRELSVAYGQNIVLQDISLSVKPAEVVALIGPNGTGKSTLIRAVSGVIPKRQGSILLGDQDLSKLSHYQRARLLAVVPQARQLGGAFNVEQTILMGRTPYINWLGQAGESDFQHVHLAMEKTSTLHLAKRRIAELSGGEQQRVFLARALAQDTPALLLDEPTTHLDLKHQASLLSLVHQLSRENDLTVLMALHDLNQVSIYADKVALLLEGRLKAVGTPQEVLTAELISEVYKTPVQVFSHPKHKFPLIFPDQKGN